MPKQYVPTSETDPEIQINRCLAPAGPVSSIPPPGARVSRLEPINATTLEAGVANLESNSGRTALVIGIVPLPPLVEHIADLTPIHEKNLTHLDVGFGLGHDLDRTELDVLLLTENYQRLRGREIKFKKHALLRVHIALAVYLNLIPLSPSACGIPPSTSAVNCAWLYSIALISTPAGGLELVPGRLRKGRRSMWTLLSQRRWIAHRSKCDKSSGQAASTVHKTSATKLMHGLRSVVRRRWFNCRRKSTWLALQDPSSSSFALAESALLMNT
ncbi:hypothetical protein DFH08DRAFT_812094 [Mycena albidolilacea]|uniref:Uncharacterized protein n=1 Tax=Mycena albidolilacea TaxID=1033008 RepID=A0AAD6ZTZ5_9AGAR|nr:hypothetical protein DFH08DRAFT_812094 [Mycena albidolilacea]